jgi:hypothetical protein
MIGIAAEIVQTNSKNDTSGNIPLVTGVKSAREL